jgi:prepilin-type processing-associated H-X9-DG protein
MDPTPTQPAPVAAEVLAPQLAVTEVETAPAALAEATGDAALKPKTRKPSAETTFRILFNEQMDLTALADSKANMMIQINGLITSIMLASSSIILDARPWLRLPCISLSSTAIISIVFAVLAARPKIQNPARLTVEDVHSGRANILFFGNFGRISEDAFVAGMREMFSDDERIYLNMSRHIYGLGRVLLGKFRLLRISYTVFLAGLFLSGALFIIGLIATGLAP